MIKQLGIGWAEVEFPYMIHEELSTWTTFARVIAMDQESVSVEYYDFQQKLVKHQLKYKPTY